MTEVPAPAQDTPPAEGNTPAESTSWHSTYSEEDRGFIENRGLNKLDINAANAALLKSVRHAEGRLGLPADRILKLPQDRTVEGAMNEVFNSLGRPNEAVGYDMGNTPDTEDSKKFVDWAKGAFHKNGLTQDQASGMFDDLVTMIEEKTGLNADAQKLAFEAEDQKLQQEWGSTYNHNVEVAKKAARQFGVSEEAVIALQNSSSYIDVMKMFQNIGAKLGEDTLVTGDGVSNTITTPAAAKVRIEELKKDTAWTKRYLSGDTAARQEMTNLSKLAVAGG